ncbi:MAG: hypothetical protein F2667_03390 [Actinobacteria bacterium]|uniref:Unannotated protein n=1 Tax=freshwater metagenome TaxID=449393 RepID=A0A6J6P732_9ZZZZ|nr:hypothetical protein [Actinomycetota bacterium]
MVRPRSLLPALVAPVAIVLAAVVPGSAVAGPASPTPYAVAAVGSPAAVEPVEPLAVTIDALTPGEIPRKGLIEVSGTVTNVDTVAWSMINLYPIISASPMTTVAELDDARDADPLEFVGDRITDAGPFDVVDSLDPGETATYSFTVARSRLPVSERGVYWFGVHALGQTDAGRDVNADGRARTLLPLVQLKQRSLPVSVVVPLRRRLAHAEDGSLSDVAGWVTTLSEGGQLRSLVDFAAGAGSRPVTLLVDPALVEAVEQLAAGNPARSLLATMDPDDPDAVDADDPTGSGAPDPSGSPDPDSGDESGDDSGSPDDTATPAPDPDDLDPLAAEAAEAAAAWLDQLEAAADGNADVLLLPYGDLDVAAAAAHDPGVYDRARKLAGDELEPLGIEAQPGIGSPLGFLDAAGLRLLHDDETVLVSDQEVAGALAPASGAPVPTVADIEGRRVIVTSSGAAEGGPGPSERLTLLSLRQRVLSEAAVRLLTVGRHRPLVVQLAPGWLPDRTTGFFDGLDLDWVDLDSAVDATEDEEAVPVDPADLEYPAQQSRVTLDPSNFAAARDLAQAGVVLQNLLTFNDEVAATVAREALVDLSYSARATPTQVRDAADASRGWIEEQLDRVGISAPNGVTLSSTSGRFSATLTNDLDEPVTVRLVAYADQPLELTVPANDLELPARSRTTVLLNARTSKPGVHNLTIALTDRSDNPIGSSADLPIRSAQVSNVIWLIMGSGAALLFGAIGVRLVRRVRDSRRLAREDVLVGGAPPEPT